ncbi:Protein Dok-7 [Papilio xuthus]|uniref:Protein Dok-7 n=1 Tax=Papilio xuthus TaxID=66420 RepID=A0A0N1PFM5_PAPXU|nr:Protein Dok-7 [Papilio xuthus]
MEDRDNDMLNAEILVSGTHYCVHLQLYKDQKERQRNGQTKASLSLQQYLGFEAGFTLDKESNTLAILCEDVVPVLAFDTREILIQWRVKVQHNLGSSKEFAAVIVSAPSGSGARAGPARLHACGPRLALAIARPPEVIALWDVKLLR